MKIYINRKPISGPWGGGNKTLALLCKKIVQCGYSLTHNLEPDIDLIFCFDPRPDNAGIWFQDLIDHKNKYNCKIVQRVGDVGSHSKPDLTKMLYEISKLKIVDHFIFTSDWARKYIQHDSSNLDFSIIQNEPLGQFHKFKNKKKLDLSKIKIVTHHWSTNPKKGFDVYSSIGELIDKKLLPNFEFTYIGRWPKDISHKGITIIEPVDSVKLSKLLPKFDIYLTASLEEAGANHVLEATACGLPIVYRKGGGSIDEYCRGLGIRYEYNVVQVLQQIIVDFKKYKSNALKYNRTASKAIERYMIIIKGLLNE
jgi:glycosyltransferase involved in cell wall biosynthesis